MRNPQVALFTAARFRTDMVIPYLNYAAWGSVHLSRSNRREYPSEQALDHCELVANFRNGKKRNNVSKSAR